ncbi:hypothetical protein C3K47_01785 [Solitalea longa]|uniref:Polysaccharide biosynthesis protein n=1 Tax=Solitalea longa TaxID=2079460 RepID=A0A2S5A9I8_9SPHI|nr:hypothetical protein [Solitalea longa]POY39250.1 hypothetical protein C3K47_01785 [Solitalea longa]
MSSSSLANILSGSLWGILAKSIDAIVKFFTIPLLVGFYGKADYGLIALAFSLNAYLRLMDMGLNIGSIRYFSMWIMQKEWDKIGKVSRSSIVFYGWIGVLNAVVFLFIAFYGGSFFKIVPSQLYVFQWMMCTLAASAVFNWASNVIIQFLTAYGELAWINKIAVLSSVLNLATVFLAIKCLIPLNYYFLLYILSTLIIIPLNIYRLKITQMPILDLIMPVWDGKAFKEILGYSVAIFAMSLFQFSADNLRPILLGKYAGKGIEVLTDYRVIQTIASLITAFGGVFLQVLLPSASKIYVNNDTHKINKLAYNGTRYISIFLSLVVFLLIVNAKVLLVLYMGKSYEELSIWLIIWLLTVLLSMHNAPIATFVLSSGKTKFLIYSSAISCILSLPITAFFAHKYNVGSAVMGYFFYIVLQLMCYYCYYIPFELKLDVKQILFKSFLPGVVVGCIACLLTYFIGDLIPDLSGFKKLIFQSIAFSLQFGIYLFLFVLKREEISEIKNKLRPRVGLT